MAPIRPLPLVMTALLFTACGSDSSGTPDGSISVGPDANLIPAADAAPASADAAADQDPDAGFDTDGGSGADAGSIEVACTLDDIQPVLQCVADNCLGSQNQPGGIAGCVALSCGAQLLALPPDCAQCVLTALSGNFGDIADQCVDGLPDIGLDGGLPTP